MRHCHVSREVSVVVERVLGREKEGLDLEQDYSNTAPLPLSKTLCCSMQNCLTLGQGPENWISKGFLFFVVVYFE